MDCCADKDQFLMACCTDRDQFVMACCADKDQFLKAHSVDKDDLLLPVNATAGSSFPRHKGRLPKGSRKA